MGDESPPRYKPPARWYRGLMLFCIYALQGVPTALIDFHLRRMWRDTGMPLFVDRQWYLIMYWPYLVRCVAAFILDSRLPRLNGSDEGERMQAFRLRGRQLFNHIQKLFSVMSLLLFLVATLPVPDPLSKKQEYRLSMWVTLVAMLGTSVVASISDVVLDAVSFENADLENTDAGVNAVQIIAFKCGKLLSQLLVTLLLVDLKISWAGTNVLTAIGILAIIWWSRIYADRLYGTHSVVPGIAISEGTSPLPEGEKSYNFKPSRSMWSEIASFGRTARSAVHHLIQLPQGRWLLVLAFTHKLGEMIVRDQMGSFQDLQFRGQMHRRTPSLSIKDVAEVQKALVLRITNILSITDLAFTSLPTLISAYLASRSTSARKGRDGLWWLFLVMMVVSVVRCFTFFSISHMASSNEPMLSLDGRFSEGVFVPAKAWHGAQLDVGWWTALISSSITTGVATSLFYIIAMAGTQDLIAAHPAAAPFRLSMYSMLEVADDLSRSMGAAASGVILTASSHERVFAAGSMLSVVPIIASAQLILLRRSLRKVEILRESLDPRDPIE